MRAAVVDTNVVVAGLITSDSDAPTARILDDMLARRFPFLLSVELLAEYRSVLVRPRLRNLHGLSTEEIDAILARLTANAIVREPERAGAAGPKEGDAHLWALVRTERGAVLVTGDRALLERAPAGVSVVPPRRFVELLEEA